METKCSNFWLGLGLGSILGAIVYRYSQTSKANQLKEKISHAMHVAADQAEDMADSAKEQALNVGKKVADKVADKTYEVAERADEIKNKVHDFVDAKK
ncbi:YtxH domain-containing protein [Phocaeicola sp.]|uniref:YtxH domain-containing protein n=1 Tax=Phocaeicola sp. TaxID=2773926 RepID=UPI0023D55799|nr:YtxH domain-containing protein [Phocaeicola sp.]MDE5676473.1 YtxH domain-containing protein [Phocaeicola sp.]